MNQSKYLEDLVKHLSSVSGYPWHVDTLGKNENTLLSVKGMMIRVNFSGWRASEQGRIFFSSLTPHRLREYRGGYHKISVSAERGALAGAKAINSRLLPVYMSSLDVMEQQKKEFERKQDIEKSLQDLVKGVGLSQFYSCSQKGAFSFGGSDGVSGRINLSRAYRCQLDLSLSADELIRVLYYIKNDIHG